ncbi:MAG: LamB/YcsF family protein [Acidobacteriota bacterium]|nr:LamB/YcsF family protein [Acidobacteriota bacterium]
MTIDLNSDMGESFGAWRIGADAGLLSIVTSANIACGMHAGDPSEMRRTVRAAKAAGVSIGAHPGFPDLAGFGRREMRMTAGELEDSVIAQVAALAGIAAVEGASLAHVKPHGALYNMAVKDRAMSDAIAAAVAAVDATLILVGLPASAMQQAAAHARLAFAAEGFADRAYAPDGTLVPRTTAGALVTDPALAAAGAVRLARGGHVQTICIHSDTPHAEAIARAVREALEAEGLRVAAPTPRREAR